MTASIQRPLTIHCLTHLYRTSRNKKSPARSQAFLIFELSAQSLQPSSAASRMNFILGTRAERG